MKRTQGFRGRFLYNYKGYARFEVEWGNWEASLFSKVFSAFSLLLLVSAHPALAFDPSDAPSDDVINNTLQCEAGKVGALLQKRGLPVNFKTAVSWTISKTTDSGWGLGFKIPFWQIGADGGLTQQDVEEAISTGVPYNLHPENLKVCRGYHVQIIKEGIGLYQCLGSLKFPSLKNVLLGGSGTTGCHTKVTLTRKLSGSLQIPVWGVGIGPNGSYGSTYVLDYTIVAPLRAK